MAELEQRLSELGAAIAYPPTPELAPLVRERLEERRRPFQWRRPLVIAFAVLVLGLAVAFAVPPARTAILRFFHIRGATVVRVETLPAAQERRAGDLGRAYSLAAAERVVGFRLLLPPVAKGRVERAYVLEGTVATVVLRLHGAPLLVSEYGSAAAIALKKAVGAATNVEEVSVGGRTGIWIQGGPHVLTWLGPTGYKEREVRVEGNVLLWTRGNLTLRLEGGLSKGDALKIAKSVR